MKILQIITESAGHEEIHKLIRLQSLKLSTLINQFSTIANHIGYEKARTEVLNQLSDAKSTDWFILIGITDPKVQKAYNNLLVLRQDLLNQINSGV